MPGKTVYLRTTADPGANIYDTIADCIAALDLADCLDAGDPGTIVPLDSGLYIGQAAFGARQYVDIRAVPGSGCAPTFEYGSGVVTTAAGATRLRIIGDPGARMLLRLNHGSGAGSDVIQPAPGCSVEVQDCDYEAPTGTANQLIQSAGSGESYTFRRCDCLQGSFASPVQNSWAALIELIDCNWLAMVDQTGPVVTTNVAVVSVVRCKLRGATLLGSYSSLGTPAGRHTLHSTVLVKEVSPLFNGLIDLRASAGGHSIGADIYRVTLIGDGAADQAGFYSEYDTADVKGCIVQGFARGWWTTVAWSPTDSTTYDCTDEYFGSASAGTGMITDDPDLDPVTYRKAEGSPAIDAGTVTGVALDVDGVAIPQGAAEDMGADEYPLPGILSATCPDRSTIVVLFDDDPPASTGFPTAWTVTPRDEASGADTVIVDSVVLDLGADTATLTVVPTGGLTCGAAYTAATPLPGVSPVANSAVAIVPITTVAAPREGYLEAWTGAVGDEVGYMLSAPSTRLTTALAPSDTEASVESTLHMLDAGIIYIRGERIAYASKTGTRLLGLTRETVIDPADGATRPVRFDTVPVGAQVVDGSHAYCLTDQVRADLRVRRCTGRQLLFRARDLGFPVPIGLMDDESIQDYVCTRLYLDAGTWWATFRVLEAMFRFAQVTIVDGEATDAQTLTTTSLPEASWHDRRAIIGDRICRVRSSSYDAGTGTTTLVFDDFDHPTFRAPELTPGATGIALRLPPFTIAKQLTYVPYTHTYLIVTLFAGGTGLPVTYLLDNAEATPADMPIGGQIMEDEDEDGSDAHPLYLLEPYIDVVEAILDEILPAATRYEVVAGA